MIDRKIIEITVTDESGETHYLGSAHGLDVTVSGAISAITNSPSQKMTLYIAEGR